MTKVWDKPITADTDWGGDASTGGLPVSGRIVQEFIKDTLASIASAIKTDEQLKDFIKSYLDEKGITSDEGFVTLATEQIIKAVKDFEKGLKINGSPLIEYDAEKDALFLPTNLVVRGAITMFGDKGTTVPSIWASFPYDNETIKFNETTGKFYAVGGGTGGGVADSVAWANITSKPEWIGASKPSYTYSEITGTPDLTIYATQSSVDAISTKLNDFLEGEDADTIINKWKELESVLSGLKESDNLATILSGKADTAELEKYMLKDTAQSITAQHDFTKGLLIDGISIKKSQDKTIYIDGNLVLSGAMTMFGADSTTSPTIWASFPYDNETIKFNETTGKFYAVGGGGIASVTYDSVVKALGYTPLSTQGGTISGNARTLLTVNTSDFYGPMLQLHVNNAEKAAFGVIPKSTSIEYGTFISNVDASTAFMLGNDGKPYFATDTGNLSPKFELLHANNVSKYALPITGGIMNAGVDVIGFGRKDVGIGGSGTTLYLLGNSIQRRGTDASYHTLLDSSNYSDLLAGGTINGSLRINKFLAVGAATSQSNTARAQINLVSSGSNSCDFYFGADDTLYWSITARTATESGSTGKALALWNNVGKGYHMTALINGNTAIGGTIADEKLHVHGNVKANGHLWINSGTYITNRANLILNSTNAPADIIFKSNSTTTGNYGYWAISSRSGEDGRFSIFRGNENSGNSSEGELFVINANGTFSLGGSASIYGNLASTGDITSKGTMNVVNENNGRQMHYQSSGFYFTPPVGGWAWGASSVGTNGATLGNAFGMYGSSNTLTYIFYGGTWDAPHAVLWPSGNLAIGLGANPPTAKLEVGGNILTTGAITMFSQASLKNIVNHEGLSLDELAQIRPARFKWKDGRDDRVHVGAIADEIVEVLPEVIYHTGEEKTMTMDYASAGHFIATSLIKPVIDHEARIKHLEAQVKTLENENKKLKQLVA